MCFEDTIYTLRIKEAISAYHIVSMRFEFSRNPIDNLLPLL